MGRNEIFIEGLETPITLRHGWGGKLKLRNAILADRAKDNLEQIAHPFAGEKFGNEMYTPTQEDYAMFGITNQAGD